MGLHECLPILASLGVGIGKTSEQLEAERIWVEGARIWLIVSRPFEAIPPVLTYQLYKMKIEYESK
jgi:hypothetical protein